MEERPAARLSVLPAHVRASCVAPAAVGPVRQGDGAREPKRVHRRVRRLRGAEGQAGAAAPRCACASSCLSPSLEVESRTSRTSPCGERGEAPESCTEARRYKRILFSDVAAPNGDERDAGERSALEAPGSLTGAEQSTCRLKCATAGRAFPFRTRSLRPATRCARPARGRRRRARAPCTSGTRLAGGTPPRGR